MIQGYIDTAEVVDTVDTAEVVDTLIQLEISDYDSFVARLRVSAPRAKPLSPPAKPPAHTCDNSIMRGASASSGHIHDHQFANFLIFNLCRYCNWLTADK